MKLLKHMPAEGVLDPELPCWISSPSHAMSANDTRHGISFATDFWSSVPVRMVTPF